MKKKKKEQISQISHPSLPSPFFAISLRT